MQIRRIKYKRDGAQTRTLNDTSIDAKHWRYDSADLRAVRSIIKNETTYKGQTSRSNRKKFEVKYPENGTR